MTASDAPAADLTAATGRDRRAWHHSIGGKLLIAFGLIAALTIGATFLSLIRFHQIDGVLHGLVDVSMPALKLSMEVQSRAADVIETASEVGNAQNEVERFKGMASATERIGNLWQAIANLRTVISDDRTMVPIQTTIARIDAHVGNLNRTVSEGLAASAAPLKMFQQIEAATAAANDAIANLLSRLNAPTAGTVSPTGAMLAQVHDLRGEFNEAARLLFSLPLVNRAEALATLRKQFDTHLARIEASVAGLARDPSFGAHATALATAARNLATYSTSDNGLFALRERFLQIRASIASITAALKEDGSQLSQSVAAIVAQAETQAADAQRASAAALATTQIWLLLIAASTLVIAVLIVWLFVHRYVVSRLNALAASMLGISRGNLATAIPPAGADELGDMSRALHVFRDNARDIQAARDQALQARAEAEEASRAKSTFLANMSHELRTPLNAVIGYSEMLAEDAADRADEASVRDLHKIQAAGKHLLGLINSVLDLSKIEAGRMDVYLEPVNLAQLIEEVRVIIQPAIERNGNRLTIQRAADAGSIRTDLTKLKQSLINLLSNAAKFTEKGNISLAVERRSGPEKEPQVVFKVADSGIGMSEEQMGRLFEAFAQADSSTTRNFGGTGLGLAITKRFATLLGGTIDVQSKPGEGSTFILTLPDLPLKAAPGAESVDATDSGPEGATLTVLIVDDDPVVHDVLTPTLTKKGYRVMHARDGAEALDMVRKTPPDVVTLDVMMPNVDGWSVLGAMKSDPALAHIPVIMLTIVDDRNLGWSLGASEYMTKPIDRERLVALVGRFAGRDPNGVVLVVDDDPEVRNLIGTTLRNAGLKPADAANGREACDWLAHHPAPNLVLLDLMMPEMDGFQFLERMREKPEWLNVPVVVLTAKELTAAERAYLAERTVLVLGKSAQPITSLGTALAAIAGRRQKPAPAPET